MMKHETFDAGTNDLLPRSFMHQGYVAKQGAYGKRPGVKTTGVRVFNSLHDFAATAEASPLQHGAGDSFANGASHADAVRMANEGWPEIMEQVVAINTRVASLVDAETVSDSYTYIHSVAGPSVDMGRYMTGHPACMVRPHPIPIAKRGKVARIVVPVCYSAGVDTEIITRRGAAVTSLIDALARAHYTLEVWAVASFFARDDKGGRSFPNRIAYSVKVCDAGMAYDPTIVGFGVGHAAMLRRLSFNCENMENESTKRAFGIEPFGHGYGQASFDCVIQDLPAHAQNGPAIVLPELKYGRGNEVWLTDESIARWIEETVTRLTKGEEYKSDQTNTY
jgi:hypothetical protein